MEQIVDSVMKFNEYDSSCMKKSLKDNKECILMFSQIYLRNVMMHPEIADQARKIIHALVLENKELENDIRRKVSPSSKSN
jgi:hypothetical protein